MQDLITSWTTSPLCENRSPTLWCCHLCHRHRSAYHSIFPACSSYAYEVLVVVYAHNVGSNCLCACAREHLHIIWASKRGESHSRDDYVLPSLRLLGHHYLRGSDPGAT